MYFVDEYKLAHVLCAQTRLGRAKGHTHKNGATARGHATTLHIEARLSSDCAEQCAREETPCPCPSTFSLQLGLQPACMNSYANGTVGVSWLCDVIDGRSSNVRDASGRGEEVAHGTDLLGCPLHRRGAEDGCQGYADDAGHLGLLQAETCLLARLCEALCENDSRLCTRARATQGVKERRT